MHLATMYWLRQFITSQKWQLRINDSLVQGIIEGNCITTIINSQTQSRYTYSRSLDCITFVRETGFCNWNIIDFNSVWGLGSVQYAIEKRGKFHHLILITTQSMKLRVYKKQIYVISGRIRLSLRYKSGQWMLKKIYQAG